MGRPKKVVVRNREMTLQFSSEEFVKMLSLAVISNGNQFASFDAATGEIAIKDPSPSVLQEISESVARLAMNRKKIPKLTTKVIKLSNVDSNDSIKSANSILLEKKKYEKELEKQAQEKLAKQEEKKLAKQSK